MTLQVGKYNSNKVKYKQTFVLFYLLSLMAVAAMDVYLKIIIIKTNYDIL